MEYHDREPQVAFFNSQIQENDDDHVLENYENRQSVIKFKDVGDEEDDLETMEIEVKTRKKAPSRDAADGATNIGSGGGSSSVGHHHAVSGHQPSAANVGNIAVISSGASLASAVTATSLLDGVEEATQDADVQDGASAQSDDGDVEDEGDGDGTIHDGSTSSECAVINEIISYYKAVILKAMEYYRQL